jgi:hypothetical protein
LALHRLLLSSPEWVTRNALQWHCCGASAFLSRTVVSRYNHRAITFRRRLHQTVCVGQIMNNDTNNKEAYRAAFTEASEELKEIFGKIEQLHLRKLRVEKAVEVLGRKIGSERPAPVYKIQRKTHLPGLTVMTRLTVVPVGPKDGK